MGLSMRFKFKVYTQGSQNGAKAARVGWAHNTSRVSGAESLDPQLRFEQVVVLSHMRFLKSLLLEGPMLRTMVY